MKELLADDFYYLMTSIDRGNDLDNTVEIQLTYRQNSPLSHGKVQELFGKGLMIEEYEVLGISENIYF